MYTFVSRFLPYVQPRLGPSKGLAALEAERVGEVPHIELERWDSGMDRLVVECYPLDARIPDPRRSPARLGTRARALPEEIAGGCYLAPVVDCWHLDCTHENHIGRF
jgi:hypothetical protein